MMVPKYVIRVSIKCICWCLHLYSTYYNFLFDNKINELRDNQSYVNKLTWLLKDDYHQQGLYINTETEVLSITIQFLSSNFTIEHIKGHQDDTKIYSELNIKAQLNIDADKIATATVSISMNTHDISLLFAIYIHNNYIHHRSDHSILVASHKREAQHFLRAKYKCSTKTFSSIN